MNAIKISVWEELRVSRNKPTGSLDSSPRDLSRYGSVPAPKS
jgi:hypothetical protein